MPTASPQKQVKPGFPRVGLDFRHLLEKLPAAAYSTNAEGLITYFNPRAAELWGREPKLNDPVDRYCGSFKLFTPDGTLIRHDQSWMAKCLQECREYNSEEIVIERPDGTRLMVQIQATPYYDEEERLAGAVNVLHDITEQNSVQTATALLGAIVDSSDDAIISKDLNGIITSWNKGAERLFGYAAGEAIGRPVTMLIPSDRQEEEPKILERLKHGERVDHFETIRMRKDGSFLDISLTISPIKDAQERIIGASKIARDITDRKRAANRLRLLWEAAAVLLSSSDPKAMLRELFAKIGPHLGLDTYLNYMLDESSDTLRLESCLGIPDQLNHSIARLEIGHAMCGNLALQNQPVHLTLIQESQEPNVQFFKSLGIRVYSCYPLLSGRKLLGTLSFASRTRDLFNPDELAFLETICHYLTVAYERQQLMNQLKEADRRKDDFLATLAHELRNPLAPVRNAVQVLRAKGPDTPELRWGHDVIDRQVSHLTRLIDDLLDVSRITRDKLELRKEPVELTEVVKGAVETSRPLIEQCGHELTLTLPPEPIYLNADLIRLAQVFMNLLTNAAKYTERGGRIWLTAERQGSEIVVRVKDTGVGIAAEKLPRLFEMFFQVDRANERSQSGLGIGLSLVRRLVEMHGGTVKAHSAGIGMGSEFIVRLPVLHHQKSLPALEPTEKGEKEARPSSCILVVDDMRDSAESLAMLLRLAGNEVHTAHDGLEAIEAAERFRPAVALLDIGMPNLDGYEACRRIREQPWGKNMMLIALTGWGQEEDKRRTEEAGFNAHLVKPVDLTALMNLLASRTKDGVPANR